MKKIVVILAYISVASWFTACKSDDPAPLTEEQQTLKNLAKTWSLNSASVDGLDVEEWFGGLQVSFTESKSFTVKNAVPPIWIAAGTFEIEKLNATFIIKRNDGVELTIATLSKTTVVLTMNHAASSGVRTEGISGSFSFTFEAE